MPFYNRKRRYSTRTRKYRGRGAKKCKVSHCIKKYVKREIHRNIENKEVLTYTSNYTLVTGTSGSQMTNFPLIPTLSQSTANNGRIGDAVRIRRGIVSGTVHLKGYDASTNPRPMPVYVKMWVVRTFPIQAQGASIGTTYTDALFKGNGANLPPQGNLLDLDLPINQEKFRVLGRPRIVRLGVTGNGTLGPANSASWFDNSSMTARFSFNWGKYTKKLLKFSEEDNYCTNDNCYLIFQTVYANGEEADGYQICQASYVNTMVFEDA